MTEQEQNLNRDDSIEEAENILATPRSEIEGVSVVNPADSLNQFCSVISELLEDDNPKNRDNA